MKIMKIIHVASFTGNIGDNANHSGFRRLFDEIFSDYSTEWTSYEIRETYWGNKKFDSDFVTYVNSFDLLVFGGGNYFELWVERSITGCSIDINKECLGNIKTPIFYNSLGVDPAQGVTEESISKFEGFLEQNIAKKSFISCRNDGSSKAIKQFLNSKYDSNIYRTVDAGLFANVSQDVEYPEICTERKNIVFQLAKDMEDIRWPGKDGYLDYNGFLKEITKAINCLSSAYNIIFVPHIYSDISIINDVIARLNDKVRRTSISVAPYLVGDRGQKYIFGLYLKSDLICGTRFHSNIVSYGLNKKLIPLVNYRQIRELVSELGIENDAIQINKPGFSSVLQKKVIDKIECDSVDQNNILEMLSEYKVFLNEVRLWYIGRDDNANKSCTN
jgi:polysaccharide pyruvyl transferase WcaK-like protein